MKTMQSLASSIVVACLVATAVRAAESVPFSAEVTAVIVGTEKKFEILELDGTADLMGPVTGEARLWVRGPRAEGALFLEALNGDRLVVSFEIDRVAPGRWEGTYTITDADGTGRFEGATGSGVMTVTFVAGNVAAVTLDGTLSF